MEDLKIIELYWNRDEEAIRETQNKYGNYCYTIAYNILYNNEDAQEIVNDTCKATWDVIPPAHPQNLSTFIGKITRNLSINRLRYLKADKRGGGEVALSFDELEGCIADTDFVHEDQQNQELTESIDRFLATLKQEQRQMFVCRYWYFDPIKEIAARFNCSDSKIKMSLKRTRDKLKTYLINEGVMYENK